MTSDRRSYTERVHDTAPVLDRDDFPSGLDAADTALAVAGLPDLLDELADARARIAAVRALCTARVPHPDRGAVPGQVYEATLRVRLIDTDVVLAALDGGDRGE